MDSTGCKAQTLLSSQVVSSECEGVTLSKLWVAVPCDCTLISGDETIRRSATDQRVSAFMAYRLRVPFVRHKLENCTVVAGARQREAGSQVPSQHCGFGWRTWGRPSLNILSECAKIARGEPGTALASGNVERLVGVCGRSSDFKSQGSFQVLNVSCWLHSGMSADRWERLGRLTKLFSSRNRNDILHKHKVLSNKDTIFLAKGKWTL